MSIIRKTAIYQHDPNIVCRNIAGEILLVPIRNNVSDMTSIYTLNETAALIWSQIDGYQSLEDIHQSMQSKFDVESEEIEQDLLELINKLCEIGAVIEVSK